jgi:hypothetical protein
MHRAALRIANTADASVGIEQPVNTSLTGQRDGGMRQGTLPHTVFEEPPTVTGNIKAKVVRLPHRARGGKGFPRGEIVHKLGAGPTPPGP